LRLPKALAKAGAWAREKLAGGEAFIKPWMIDLADDHYPVDIGRAQERLNWHPRRRLRDTLVEMIRRLKSDPVRWYKTNGLPVPEELEVRV
jgi:nucleoside-diphosphate-sugar epimerase